jgi:SAM-dependent methyltransferase
MPNVWSTHEHADENLARVDGLPFRAEGVRVLVDDVGTALPGRVLDLGCGDGRLAAAVLEAYPGSTAVALDMSPPMLEAATRRFDGDPCVAVVAHDFDEPLPFTEPFDAIVTSFAMHHVGTDDRARALYRECAALLTPGGVFANLEIVQSPTRALHDRWRAEMGARDDPADHLRDLGVQLGWLRDAGLGDVDCIWKWRSLALMRGELLRS